MTASATVGDRLSRLEAIGTSVARPAAADVDARARFPHETLAALKEAQLLGVAVPKDLGGDGSSLEDMTRMCLALGKHCASSGMMLAMHHIQVLSIGLHLHEEPELRDYLRKLVREQRLIASATSEVGPSGDMRKSVAAVERDGDSFTVTKQATTISYGAHADDILLTARRGPDAAPSEQVLVLLPRGTYELQGLGTWDTLGMRGTTSAGATVVARGSAWQVMQEPFASIAVRTMVPASHVLWAGVWLGIATDAVGVARGLVRQKARQDPGVVSPAARRLADVVVSLELMHDKVFAVAREFDDLRAGGDPHALESLGFAMRVNGLKLAASTMVAKIVADAMEICGIAAYKNDSPHSLGRHLRDAFSAALMINNDRLRETNASMLMVRKGD